ncbi:hypothetical protein ACRFZW_000548 [Escherichia coli]
MITITNKKQYPSEQYLNELITNIEFAARAPVEVVRAMAAELQKRREADSAEPVAYIFKHPAGKLFWALTDESNKDQSDVIPVYAAPPVPVVPAALPENDDEDGHDIDYLEPSEVYALGRTAGWNACRAAMLHSAEPVSQAYKLNALDGNSPVTPDGWVMVPKELTPEMMRAVQIRSELGGYATSNLSGAYNMFSEFWNVAVSAAPKVDDL